MTTVETDIRTTSDILKILTNEAKFFAYASLMCDPLLILYTKYRYGMFAQSPRVLDHSFEELAQTIDNGKKQAMHVKITENKRFTEIFEELFGINEEPEVFVTRLIFFAYLGHYVTKQVPEFVSFCLMTAEQILQTKICNLHHIKVFAMHDRARRESELMLKIPDIENSKLIREDIPRLNQYLEKLFSPPARALRS